MKMSPHTAMQTYGAAQRALGASKPESGLVKTSTQDGGSAAFDAIHALAKTVAAGENASIAYMTGGADPHSVVEAMAAAELAVETAVTVRNKVVEAYQELLRMPV